MQPFHIVSKLAKKTKKVNRRIAPCLPFVIGAAFRALVLDLNTKPQPLAGKGDSHTLPRYI